MNRHAESFNMVFSALVASEGLLSELDAAAIVGLSPRRFRTVFRSISGETFRVLRLRIRMMAARRRLLETKQSITTISEQLGYSNRHKLEASFKEAFLMTPSQFRKEHLEKN